MKNSFTLTIVLICLIQIYFVQAQTNTTTTNTTTTPISCTDRFCSSCPNKVCLECMPRYYLNLADSSCLACYPGCQTCNGTTLQTCSGAVCGDGFRLPLIEACDDNNTIPGDGCSQNCQTEFGFNCTGGSVQTRDICVRNITLLPLCGDGLRTGNETCDDNNTLPEDGCTPQCQVQFGFDCSGGSANSSDKCVRNISLLPICGDGLRTGRELCDDGNLRSGDGCSQNCSVEQFYRCFGENMSLRDVCNLTYTCGNGRREDGEQCDDGNEVSQDGCSSLCRLEQGFKCMMNIATRLDSCVIDTNTTTFIQTTSQCNESNCTLCWASNNGVCLRCNQSFLLKSKCVPQCPEGFTVVNQTCRPCQTGCKNCPVDLVLLRDRCVEACPEGFSAGLQPEYQDAQKCYSNRILNVSFDRIPRFIPINQKISFSVGNLTSEIEFNRQFYNVTCRKYITKSVDLQDDTQSDVNNFVVQGSTLTLSAEQVTPGLICRANYTIANLLTEVTKNFTFRTLPPLQDFIDGTLTVSPETGIAYQTQFIITSSGWNSSFASYRERFLKEFPGTNGLKIGVIAQIKNLKGKFEREMIISQDISSLQFANYTFPAFLEDKQVEINLVLQAPGNVVYRVSKSISVTTLTKTQLSEQIKQQAQNISKVQNLKDPSQVNTIAESLVQENRQKAQEAEAKIRATSGNITSNTNTQQVRQYKDGEACQNTICNGQGKCAYQRNKPRCTCNDGYGGDYCEKTAQELQDSRKVHLALTESLKTTNITTNNVEQVVSSLEALTESSAILTKDSTKNLVDLISKTTEIIKSNPEQGKQQVGNIINAASNLANAVLPARTVKTNGTNSPAPQTSNNTDKDALTKDEAKQSFKSSVTSINTAIDAIKTNIKSDEKVSASNSLVSFELAGLKGVGSRRLLTQDDGEIIVTISSQGATTDSGRTRLSPQFIIKRSNLNGIDEENVVVKTTCFSENPHQFDDQDITITTESCSIEFFNKNTSKQLQITNMQQKALVRIPKTENVGVRVGKRYDCSYWDEKKNAWSQEGVVFKGEDLLYIICETSHFSEFSASAPQPETSSGDTTAQPSSLKSSLSIVNLANILSTVWVAIYGIYITLY